MKIAFLGLGGVGGYFGAKMAREYADAEGVEIVFLAREKTAEVIRRNGIKLITPTEEFVAHPRAVYTPADNLPAVDILICSVKSYDLEQALENFRACITEDTAILPLLNGVDAEEKIRLLFPANDVWSGCVYIVSRLTAPGVITQTGNIHQLHFGSQHDRHGNLIFLLERMEGLFERTLHHHSQIQRVIWEKFVFISPLASLTSYLDIGIGKILENKENRQLLESLLHEICAVAHAKKITLTEHIVSTTLGRMGKLPFETTSSMHSDFRQGTHTEFRSLTAFVVQQAEEHGVEVPVYRQILSGLEMRTASTRD